jgi:hypothetical protein
MTPKYAKLTRLLIRATVGAGLAGVVCELSGVTSPAVSVLVLIFIAVAPAAAIAGLLRGFDPFARIVLAAVTAIVAVALIAMVMLAAGLWSPKGGLVAIAVISAACLLAQRAAAIKATIVACGKSWRQALTDRRAAARDGRASGRAAKPPEAGQGQAAAGSALPAGRSGRAEIAESGVIHGTAEQVTNHHRVETGDGAAADLPGVRDHA